MFTLNLFIFFACILNAVNSAPVSKNGLELSVIHLNDFHARFEETSSDSSPCKSTDCIGGFSRVFTQVEELLNTRPNAVFLNAGDNFQGTLWYNIYRWNVTKNFLNKLHTDAYTLGNHEFDNKIAGVVPFIKSLNAPTIVANIDDSLEPTMQGLYNKSTIIERSGHKIGIIGVIAQNTDELSSTEKLKFTDEVEAVNKEAIRLKETENCKIIIVLSHCGIEVDKHIAQNAVPHVNLIVGGHSHTLLYSGKSPNGHAAGPYPTVIERENGRKVLVVQASAYTKYLGNLTVWYNDNGDIINWEGKPIYLNTNVPQDEEINEEIKAWKAGIEEYSNRVIGSSSVLLTTKSCHSKECNLGNLLTDAMVDHYVGKGETGSWTYASVAIINSGGIRSPISQGNITYGDIMTTSPFEGTIDSGELTGKQIKDFLEYSVNDSKYGWSFMQFLQVSGMKVVFDITKPIGSRVVSLKIKCRLCDIPKYENYEPDTLYRILMTSFVSKGGDGYSMIRDNLKNKIVGDNDVEIFEKYITKMSPITTGEEGRITVLE